jgi:hypothetical protein
MEALAQQQQLQELHQLDLTSLARMRFQAGVVVVLLTMQTLVLEVQEGAVVVMVQVLL